MRFLISILAAWAGTPSIAQSPADLAKEAWAVRQQIAATYSEPALSKDACAIAHLISIGEEVGHLGDEALKRELQFYFEPSRRLLRPADLWKAMLTPDGIGLKLVGESELTYQTWQDIAVRVRDNILASGFESSIDQAFRLPVHLAPLDTEGYDEFSRALYSLIFLLDARLTESWHRGEFHISRETTLRLLRIAKALDAKATFNSCIMADNYRRVVHDWLRSVLRDEAMIPEEAAWYANRLVEYAPPDLAERERLLYAHFLDDLQRFGSGHIGVRHEYQRLSKRLAELVYHVPDAEPAERIASRNEAHPISFIVQLLADGQVPTKGEIIYGNWQWGEHEARRIALERSLLAALQIKQFQDRRGMSPSGLDDLVPEHLDAVPLDPFDGRPLRYTFRPHDRYELYSVGWDGVDNGGNWHPRRNFEAATQPFNMSTDLPAELLEAAGLPTSMPPLRIVHEPVGYDWRLDPWAPD